MVPLQFFEMVHFSAYSSETYKEHFRQMRLATKQPSSTQSSLADTSISQDPKLMSKNFNDSKWTRQALATMSMAAQAPTPVVVKKEHVKKEKYVNPF